MSWSPPPLYAILDEALVAAAGLQPAAVLAVWLGAGIRLVQFRSKTRSLGRLLESAGELTSQARAAGAAMVVNDRADVAALVGADGVHVGQTDLSPEAVRGLVGPGAVVGLSTHSEAQWTDACGRPVTYVAVGPVFPTRTKAAADAVVGLAGVARAAARARAAGLPVVAIGGITADRAADVLAAGAASVAIASDLLAGDWKMKPGSIMRRLSAHN